jgi:NADH-quinone oxidoreductase subunit J
MLTPTNVELPALASSGQRTLALVVAAGFFLLSSAVLLSTPWRWAAQPLDQATTLQIGIQLLGNFVLPFEIASVLLTAAMIGAIVIAQEE